MKEKLLHSVVSDVDVGETIVVAIRERHPQSSSFFRRDPGALADILECAVAAVAIKNVGCSRELFRRTVGMPLAAAALAVFRIPFHVAGDKQIQLAVVVIIKETRRNRPASSTDTRLRGHVSKAAIPVVMVKNVLSIAGDVEVGIAIIIVVADRDSHAVVAVAGFRQASLLGYVSEATVAVLPVEPVPVAWIVPLEVLGRLHRIAQLAAIHQKNVE